MCSGDLFGRLEALRLKLCAVGEAADELRVNPHRDRLRAILSVERGPSGPLAFASGGHATPAILKREASFRRLL